MWYVQDLWTATGDLVIRTQPSGPLCLWQCLYISFFKLDTCGENSVLRSSFVKTCLHWIGKFFSYCADDGGGAFVGGRGLGGVVVGGAGLVGLGVAHVGVGAKTTSKTVPAWPVAVERAFFKSSNSWGVIKSFSRDLFPIQIWLIRNTWPKASSFSMLAFAPEQVLQLVSIGEAAASASEIWRKAHFLTFCCFFLRLFADNRETREMETERDQARAHLVLVIVDVCDFYIVAWLRSSLPPAQFFLVILWRGVVFLVENHLNLQMRWDNSYWF